MSTRGFVGIGTPTQFDGRYNHWDSYPTGLGAKVWATAQRFLSEDGDLDRFARTFLGYTDWRQMETGGLCAYCGQHTGQPHSISGLLLIADQYPHVSSLAAYRAALQHQGFSAPDARRRAREEWPIVRNLQQTGYPDPQSQHHQHATPDHSAITPDTVDWLFMEWAYLIDPASTTFYVMVGGIETPLTYTVDLIRPNGYHETLHKTRYMGAMLAFYAMRLPAPRWFHVEAAGDALRDSLRKAFAANDAHPLLAPLYTLPRVEVWDQRKISTDRGLRDSKPRQASSREARPGKESL